jgi:hypothetical protein
VTAARTMWELGCLMLFLMPFAGVGVVTAGLAVQRAAAGNWREALFYSVFALTFGGVGLGGIAAALAGSRKVKDQEALESKYPDQPWLWRQDWASGRIGDANRSTVLTAWIFAAFWNLVSFPGAFFGVYGALKEGNHVGLFALLFPLVGIGLLVWAARATIRYRKYGASHLQLATIPAAVGRTLVGIVSVPGSLRPPGFLATLSCIRRVTTGSGKNRSSSENILWEEERSVQSVARREPAGMVTNVPVAFRIPADASVTDSSTPSNCVLWRLRLSAEVPGVDYDSVFEVPVFRTAASDQPLTAEEEQLTPDPIEEGTYQQPPDSRIVVTTNRRGTEISFPAARNVGAAVGLTIFTLLWIGAIAFQIYLKVPALFPIAFGLFGILLVMGMLDIWLGVSRVTVDAGRVTLATGYLYPSKERTLSVSEIADVLALIGMKSGATPYYDVVIVRKNGKKLRAGRGVRDKREAEWLAATIRDAVGKQ